VKTMRPPIFVRSLSDTEKEHLETALRSKVAFVMRRAQIILASHRSERASTIARSLGCGSQTVRDAIHHFNERGLAALEAAKSSRPKHTRDAFEEESAEALRGRCSTAPRGSSDTTVASGPLRWQLRLPSRKDSPKGGSRGRPSGRLWHACSECAGSGPNAGSPLPILCTNEKRRRDRLMRVAQANPDWAVGFCDECWWSRVALPTFSSWSEEGKPHRMIQRSVAKDDPEPKAVSCYGLYLPELDDTWLRFVDGRPVSSITTQFLWWCSEKLEAAGKKVLVLIWDNASWHISRQVRRWLGKHNQEVKRSGCGVRIVSCLLPKQSPWLNAIEPKWVHGKRKVGGRRAWRVAALRLAGWGRRLRRPGGRGNPLRRALLRGYPCLARTPTLALEGHTPR
jgi:transposase